MGISVSLDMTNGELAAMLSKQMIPYMTKLLVNVANDIRPQLKILLKESIMESPEVQSLLGGKLQAELGLENSQQAIDEIIDIWARTIRIDIRPPQMKGGYLFYGGLDIYAIRADFADVLSSNEAIYRSEKSGRIINWLEWLLLEGDKSIVIGYTIGPDKTNKSRTGLGKIMKENKQRNWSVPPEFAGTVDDNFVTRALDDIEIALEGLFAFELLK